MFRSLTIVATAAALLVGAEPAAAAVLHVNAVGDGLGDCVTPGGSCTLRGAIVEAKVGSPGEADTIHLGPGVHVNDAQDFIVSMNEQLTIVGAGARATTVREVGGGDGRVFLVEQGASLTLGDMTVSGSRDNSAVLLFGGDNAIRATRVTFTGNAALDRGGAIDGTAGVVALTDSTLSGNVAAGSMGAAGRGGAIFSGGTGASLALTNVTVSGNTAGSGAGIHVAAGANAALTAVTLAGNQMGPGTGAEPGDLLTVATAPPVQLAGTIVGRCAGLTPASLGSNLEPASSCGLAGAGDRPGQDPLLGALADNGGPTDTHALAPGSPAIDAAPTCPGGPADQRGVARPQGAACDIGAYEALAPVVPELAPPRLSRLVVAPRAFKASSRRRARVRYRLDAPATVRLRLDRAHAGRRAQGRCVRPGKARRRARACVRWTSVRGSFTHAGEAGANRLRLRGRVLAATRRPGRYRLVAVPRNDQGAGRVVHARFRVLARR